MFCVLNEHVDAINLFIESVRILRCSRYKLIVRTRVREDVSEGLLDFGMLFSLRILYSKARTDL